MSTQVQALTIAMFGAYAGGYTADIQARVDSWGLAAAADSLVGFQQPLLGLDLSDNAVWIDVLLGNLGIDSTNAAYTEAQAWAASNLAGGASRGDVVAAAVTYLQGDVAPAFQAIADAFEAQVAAGVTYSAGEGADEVAIGALRVAAGNPDTATGFNLTTALLDVAAAQQALEDFQDAQVDDEATDTLDESDVDAVLVAAGEDLPVGTYDSEATDAQNAATRALAIADADKAVADASKVVADLNKVVAGVTGLATPFANYQALFELDAAADKVATLAGAVEDDAVTLLLAHKNAALDAVVITEPDSEVGPVVNGGIAYDPDTETADDSIELVVWNADKEAFELSAAMKAIAADANADVADKQFLADATDLFDAFVARLAADAEAVITQADLNLAAGAVDDYDVAIAAFTAGSVSVNDNGIESAAELAAAISAKQDLLEAAQKDQTDLADALVAFDAALALVTERDDLQDAIDAAKKVITDEGFNLVEVDGNEASTAGDDVFVATGTAGGAYAISTFGTLGSDVLYIGTGYTLNEGKAATDGDDAVLEVFLSQNAAGNAVVTLETEKFGSNSAEAEVVITLTGVSLAEIELTSSGYIQLV